MINTKGLPWSMLCYSSVSIMRPCMSLILAHAHFVERSNLDQHGCRTLHMSCPSLLAIPPLSPYYVMVGWLTVKDKTCVTYDSHVDQDSTSLQSAHAPRSSSYKGAWYLPNYNTTIQVQHGAWIWCLLKNTTQIRLHPFQYPSDCWNSHLHCLYVSQNIFLFYYWRSRFQ